MEAADSRILLDLGLQTVRSYRKTMMKKLGVSNVAGLKVWTTFTSPTRAECLVGPWVLVS